MNFTAETHAEVPDWIMRVKTGFWMSLRINPNQSIAILEFSVDTAQTSHPFILDGVIPFIAAADRSSMITGFQVSIESGND